jgi:signal transduction histidine kinase
VRTTFFFIFRKLFAWVITGLIVLLIMSSVKPERSSSVPGSMVFLAAFITLTFVLTNAFSHVRRVRFTAASTAIDSGMLANRHRRHIEIPFDANEGFAIVEATLRDLPRTESIESAADSLQVRARVRHSVNNSSSSAKGSTAPSTEPNLTLLKWIEQITHWSFNRSLPRDRVLATVTPGDGTCRLTLVCEPEYHAWRDWYQVDYATNLENAEAITRAIARRIAERRRADQAATKQTVTEKELTVAKLSLLHAQVEPHFLYNTLASAQYLTRTDPARADLMLGNLITYLQHSLPRTQDSPSTIGEELERVSAYLEILKIRMGARLSVQVDVLEALKTVPFPTMMLQTLVENAIKHGLEPKTGGGTIWIIAKPTADTVTVSVADDGCGFNPDSTGTGIGLKNVRERLALIYGNTAQFSIVANFPHGVTASICVPTPASISVPNVTIKTVTTGGQHD